MSRILGENEVGIVEGLSGKRERNMMLSQVVASLSLIPFELHGSTVARSA